MYKLHHPFALECYFLKTNLHLLARSSSKASDHSWASSGEGLQKEMENIRLHCSSFTVFVKLLSYLKSLSPNLPEVGAVFPRFLRFHFSRVGGVLQEVAQSRFPIFNAGKKKKQPPVKNDNSRSFRHQQRELQKFS